MWGLWAEARSVLKAAHFFVCLFETVAFLIAFLTPAVFFAEGHSDSFQVSSLNRRARGQKWHEPTELHAHAAGRVAGPAGSDHTGPRIIVRDRRAWAQLQI